MEESHYFLKGIGLEGYMNSEKTFCESLGREDVENLDYSGLAYGETESRLKMNKLEEENSGKKREPDKQDQEIVDEISQTMAKVEADDFFSSLELQSSAKTMSSGLLTVNFQNKPLGGIVTRSRSLMSTGQDHWKVSESKTDLKTTGKIGSKGKQKKKTKSERVKRVEKSKKKIRKTKPKKTNCKKIKKCLETFDTKKQQQQQQQQTQQYSGKFYENLLPEKGKEEDDWPFLQQLEMKKELGEEKLFGNKHVLSGDLTNPIRRSTSELFSMSSILMNDVMSEDKDEVGGLIEDDYDDAFLEDIEEFDNAPPRSHTGGKWKPGSLPVRTSPMLWQSQNWEVLLDEGSQDEGKKMKTETIVPDRGDGKSSLVNPEKSKSHTSFSPSTGGKWKPVDIYRKPKKNEGEIMVSESGGKWRREWKCNGQSFTGPPVCHTGGKWKPTNFEADEDDTNESPCLKFSNLNSKKSTNSHSRDYWSVGHSKRFLSSGQTFDAMAACQNASVKHLKTSGGTIQYYCSPCNRRLSSKKMFGKHVRSELHLKRILQENDLEFDSRSLKMYRGYFAPSSLNDRGLGKRVIKRPETYKNDESNDLKRENEKPLVTSVVKVKGKKISKKEMIRCDVCKIRIPSYQLGKHLVSYYHTRRSQLGDPRQRDLVLNNIGAIVKQAPYQCAICKFYCNSHVAFKRHWRLDVHKELEDREDNHRFWCAFCNFECDAARSMELHLDSNSHREVIQAINRSIPIIIRHKKIFRCGVCCREFRFNRELMCHRQAYHSETLTDDGSKYVCTICQRRCKGMKSLQKHIIRHHKNSTKVPYFCSVCNEFFGSATEAKDHRNGQLHKFKKDCAEKGRTTVKSLSRSCPYCEETLENLEKLKDHLMTCHRPLLPKCMKCGRVFALSQEISRHVRRNECQFPVKETSSALYKCEICPFSTDLQSEFLLHAAIHGKRNKSDRNIKCPLCDSCFTQSALGIHLRTHIKEESFKCSMCPSTFVRKDRYSAHFKLKHFNKESSSTSKSEEVEQNLSESGSGKNESQKEYQTGTLQSVDGSSGERKEPTDKTSIEKRQICGDPKCKFVPKDSKDLEQHSLIHVGPKMYQCPECPYFGKTNTIIKRHYMIHREEKQYSCPHCPFKGRLNSHLKRHLRLHTGAKPYKCPHCPYTCNILENLRKHVLFTKIHPGKKLYECKMCSFDTNASKEFKSHLIESHGKDCRVADAIVAAGVYNKNEDVASSLNPIIEKGKTLKKKVSPKQPSEKLKKKIEILTQSFAPIAPKPAPTTPKVNLGVQSPYLKRPPGNSLEDKRKLLEVELGKLKKSIKPEPKKTIFKSYPSPADKAFRTRKLDDECSKAEAFSESKSSTVAGCQKLNKRDEIIEYDVEGSEKVLLQDGDVMLVVPQTNTSSGDETFSKIGIQSLKLSPSTYVLCDDETESQENENFYSIDEDYQV